MSETTEIKKVNLEQLADLIGASVRDLEKEQLKELLAILKEKYNLEPMVQEVVVAGGGEETVEEKTSFNVILKSLGGPAVPVIKAWKAASGRSLMEAKGDVTGECPITLVENAPKDKAEMIKATLEEAGAEIELA